jgi:FkbM family methyltransferase
MEENEKGALGVGGRNILGGVIAARVARRLRRSLATKQEIFRERHATPSYSQCGEDVIVDYVFRLRGIERPSYLDIGANHPFYISNTARFYERGCRGVNIDPNPELIKLFNEHRPEDINLNIGVGEESGESDLFLMEDPTLSTFSTTERDQLVAHGKRQAGSTKVRLLTLPDIVQSYCRGVFPDFMSIDVEGMEMSILKSIDFENSFPKAICVEIAEYSPIGAGSRRMDIAEFLASKNYYEYANTNLNAIMVRKEFWFQEPAAV